MPKPVKRKRSVSIVIGGHDLILKLEGELTGAKGTAIDEDIKEQAQLMKKQLVKYASFEKIDR